MKAVKDIEVEDSEAKEKEESTAKQLPEPSGYRILIALPEAEETTEGGIIKAAAYVERESVGSICGFVMKLGPDAYQDKKRFPNGSYCKEGDWIIMRSYTGTRFEAVVEDPRGVVKHEYKRRVRRRTISRT